MFVVVGRVVKVAYLLKRKSPCQTHHTREKNFCVLPVCLEFRVYALRKIVVAADLLKAELRTELRAADHHK